MRPSSCCTDCTRYSAAISRLVTVVDCPTVTVTEPKRDGSATDVAVMLAVPGVMARMLPLVETVAMPGALLCQTTPITAEPTTVLVACCT